MWATDVVKKASLPYRCFLIFLTSSMNYKCSREIRCKFLLALVTYLPGFLQEGETAVQNISSDFEDRLQRDPQGPSPTDCGL